MFEKLKALVLNHGIKIMLAGFAISAGGMIFYIKYQRNPHLQKIVFIITLSGIGIYIIGRVGVSLERRRARRHRESLRDETEEEEDL